MINTRFTLWKIRAYEQESDPNLLFQIENGDAVSDRADDIVPIFGETQVALAINCSIKIGELQLGYSLVLLSYSRF
jgi:hypothetical protein